MAHCRFIDFDITIHGQQTPYLVHAVYRQHAATGLFAADSTQPEWTAYFDHLDQARGGVGRRVLEEMGGLLYAHLFRDQVRDLWVRACTELNHDTDGICIRLMAEPPAVAALPWEVMFDPEQNLAFAGSIQTPFVRVEKLLRHVGHVRSLVTRLPLRLLIATPEDPTGQIDGKAEVARLSAALGALAGSVVTISVLDGRFNIVELRQAIAQEQPDILHLVTHGQPDGLLLWQHDEPAIVPASSLRVALEGAYSIKLVVLNACATAQGALGRRLASVGAQLLQTGAPAVIAMQYDIEENVASDFAQFFYEALLGGHCPGAVHRAVSFARSNLYALNPDSIGYGTPVLWLNAADGAIFEMEDQLMPPFSLRRTTPPDNAPDLKPLKRQRQQFEEWHAGVIDLGGAPLPVALRAVQRPLQDALQEIDDLLVQLRRLDLEPVSGHVFKQYEEKLALIIAKQNTVNRLAVIIRDQQERPH